MTRLPVLSGERLVSILQKHGFEITRQKGSHVRLRHADGRVVTIPVHPGHDLKRGLLAKILKDAGLSSKDIDK